MTRAARAGAFAVAACLAVPAAASAHKPLFMETPAGAPVTLGPLPDGTVSYAAYGSIRRAGGTRVLSARLAKGALLHVEVLIPDRLPERDRALTAMPAVAVTGPGGWRRAIPAVAGSRFDEPITRTAYLRRGGLDIPAPRAGRYTVRVTARAPGRVVVALGTRESFGAGDIAALPAAVARVRAWYAPGG